MNNATYDRKFVAMMRKLRKVQGSLNALQRDIFGAAEGGSTPQARFEDRLLTRFGLVRGRRYAEEEITERLRQGGVTDAEERVRFKLEFEQMGLMGEIPRHPQELKAQALGLRPRPLSGLARYGIDDSGARTYTEPELDALLQLWNLDPTVRIGLKAEVVARGLLRG